MKNPGEIVKSCENCAKCATCQKFIGYRFGFCNTDFEPKTQPPKGKRKGAKR